MAQYEVTYLADPQLDETAKNKLDETVDALITARDGAITYSSATNAPGSRRRLHYLIGGKNVAWLRTLQLELSPEKVTALRDEITHQPSVLRISVLNTPRREEVSAAILDQPPVKTAPKQAAHTKPHKEITAEEVEKGIERALEEEVK